MSPLPNPAPLEPESTAVAFARDLARRVEAQLHERLLGLYLIGSLAHQGFNRRYSDIDMALIAATGAAPAAADAIRTAAPLVSQSLAAKLSVFWTDRHFAIGRFPLLDRIDYLDHAIPLVQHERVQPPRPTLDDVRAELGGAPFRNWMDNAQRFSRLTSLEPAIHKPYLRALLYPARFVYSWTCGRVTSNDEAVDFLDEQAPRGLDVGLVRQALDCRRAEEDPVALFPARTRLLHQVEACARLLTE